MDADDHEDDGPEVEIRSPLDAVDPVAATVSVLAGRLTIDASHAELDGALDLADLKAKLDAAVAAGKTLEVEVEVDPASLAGGGLLVAEEIEVQEKQEEADVRCCTPDDDEGNECEERSVAECAAHGGLDLGPGSCEPNPCP